MRGSAKKTVKDNIVKAEKRMMLENLEQHDLEKAKTYLETAVNKIDKELKE